MAGTILRIGAPGSAVVPEHDPEGPIRTWLAGAGYDPDYGARPLKRLIQRHVGDPLARALIGGTFGDGDKITVTVAENGDGLTLT